MRFNNRFLLALLASSAALPALAATPAATPQISGAIDDNAVVALAGSRAGAVLHAKDAGALEAGYVLSNVTVVLKRSPASQAAFDRLVAEQQIKGSAHYHRWLSADELHAYGPAQADIEKVSSWLTSHGLTINAVSPTGMSIDVAGTAAQLGQTFHTALHHYTTAGGTHLATTTDAAIPASLAPVLQGVTLSNFFPRPNVVAAKPFYNVPLGTGVPPLYAVAPFDFNTIYNVDPLLSGQNGVGKSITGAAVTIAVVEETNIQPKDWQRFRTFFGLSGYSGQLRALHPGNCTNPGLTGDEGEAALDAEWAGAAAPDADVVEASCAATETTFGVETSLRNLVEGHSTNATIYSISYGGCEQENGLSFLQDWANLAEEGAARGVSIVISAGDSGSSCDRNVVAQNGLGVNGLSSNQYVTSVGGTDFYDTALGQNKAYWNAGNTGFGHSSAKSYVPEIPWDNSCANSIVAKVQGNTTGLAYCNGPQNGVTQDGVGGTGGTSVYYSKPAFQKLTGLTGMPKDGARDQPDVSFFAANGIWNHAYLICMSDSNEGGAPCEYTGISPSGYPNAIFQAVGGTSVSAPAFAGILALETQVAGAALGNVNPRLYELAQMQYGNSLLAKNCNSSLGKRSSSGCIFHNVTAGDNAEACYSGTPDCFTNSLSTKGIGILSSTGGKNEVNAYPATPGYNLPAPLGSLDVANLIYNF